MTKQKRFLNFRLPAELFEQLDAIFWWGQKQRVLVNWVRIFCAIWDLAKSEKGLSFSTFYLSLIKVEKNF